MTNNRKFDGEQYLRSEHLLRGGKYQSPVVEITAIVADCPVKKGDKDTTTMGVVFKNSDKVLGLNRTNYSLICIQTGEGTPEHWIGHKVQLVVRLVSRYIKKERVEEPAIRVWPSKEIPRGQIRDQMGREIPDSWYGTEKPNETKEEP